MQQILFQIHIARSQEKITVLLGRLVSRLGLLLTNKKLDLKWHSWDNFDKLICVYTNSQFATQKLALNYI